MRGRLIALDGTSGPAVQVAARGVMACLRREGLDAGITRWDASGIFYELRHGVAGDSALTPRTLVLLYAADLAFRLHWDILPALDEGRSVIAAPYVETAIAFGKATSLSRRWLHELFRFAPAAQVAYRIEEDAPDSLRDALDGFYEYSSHPLAGSAGFHDLCRRAAGYLDGRERVRVCRRLPRNEGEAPARISLT